MSSRDNDNTEPREPRRRVEVASPATPAAMTGLDAALDSLAGALADRFIRTAREQVVAEIGRPVCEGDTPSGAAITVKLDPMRSGRE